MSDGQYPPLTDQTDDLPRTLRRERESRERAAREMQARSVQSAERTGWDRSSTSPVAQPSIYAAEPAPSYEPEAFETKAATVTRFKVPFFSLMGFFIKCVFAAIPALIILIAMLYGLGIALQTYFPQLIKMKILISFP
ncbi:MAG: hypothetical protein ABL901_11635 [Hyphomicrobiaceae bacterium]